MRAFDAIRNPTSGNLQPGNPNSGNLRSDSPISAALACLQAYLPAALLAILLAGCAGGIADFSGPDAPRFAAYPATPAPRVALVLGAGGPRGFAEIGVLKVLEENHIEADLVVGSSVGAIIGALYANGMSAAEMEKIAMEFDPKSFLGVSLSGISGRGGAIESFIEDHLGAKPLQGLKRRLTIAAARKSDLVLTLFNHGNAGAAVRASSATPNQFSPVRINGVEYFDGDEATPVPIRAARQLGPAVVIAVDVSAYVSAIPPEAPTDWVERDRKRAAQVAAERDSADVLIHPDLGYYAGISEKYRRMCIARGEAAARAALPKIREALAKAKL